MDDKIIGNNCYGIMINSSEYSKKSLINRIEFHQAALGISIINAMLLTNLMDHNFCEGVYVLNQKGLKIEYLNTKYTSTEFRVYTDNPDNPIISGKISLAGLRNNSITFSYYKPDVLNLTSLNPDNEDLERKVAQLEIIKMMLKGD